MKLSKQIKTMETIEHNVISDLMWCEGEEKVLRRKFLKACEFGLHGETVDLDEARAIYGSIRRYARGRSGCEESSEGTGHTILFEFDGAAVEVYFAEASTGGVKVSLDVYELEPCIDHII